MPTGYPDWQKIAQWLGAPIAQATALALGAGTHTDGPFPLASWASVVVAIKPTGGPVTVTVKQQVGGAPVSLVEAPSVVVPNGQVVFESFVLFGDSVSLILQGAIVGTTVDYAFYPSNTTTNAQLLASAVLQFQHNEVLVASEPGLDFVDDLGFPWSVTDDAPNSRIKVKPPPGVARTLAVENNQIANSNNAAQVGLDSATCTIPAGAMGHNGWARFRAAGQMQNATGVPQNLPRWAIGIAGIVFNIDSGFGGLGVGMASSGSLFGWILEAELQMHGVANACVWTVKLFGTCQGNAGEVSNLLTTGEGLYDLQAHGMWSLIGFNYDTTTNYDTGARTIILAEQNPLASGGYQVWCDRRALEVCYVP